MLADPSEFDPAITEDVIVYPGAAQRADAVAEGDVAAKELAFAIDARPGPLSIEVARRCPAAASSAAAITSLAS